MGFFGGYKWETNPGLGAAQAAIAAGRDRVLNTRAAGNQWWRSLLQGARRGDFSGIFDPSTIQAAADEREIRAGQGMSLEELNNPDLGKQRADLKIAKVGEQAGINRYNFVGQNLQGAASGNAGFGLEKMKTAASLDMQQSENEMNARKGHETAGWGGALFSGLLGGAGAAGDLGWSPFGKTPAGPTR